MDAIKTEWIDPAGSLDVDCCYRAIQTRDARFDGRFFTAVTSTGIYCRPICPARTPMRKHCRFFRTAASAQQAGFRACLRCRPEIAPESPAWRGTANTVSRAMARIAEGALDGPRASVGRLAEGLGVGERQLRRLFDQQVGASPLAVAQTRRVLFAKQLLHETRLPMASVAMAAGFGSIRRFNDTFHALYKRPPSQLRRRSVTASSNAPIVLRLPYRPPFDWGALLAFFTARAIPGVEEVSDGTYRRVVRTQSTSGGAPLAVIAVSHAPVRRAIEVEIVCEQVKMLPVIAARLRSVFDLNADTETIATHLSSDAALARVVRGRPGLRCPGGWDAFEIAVRAILGQQVSVTAARQLAGRLVRLCTSPIASGDGSIPAGSIVDRPLTHAFPSAEQVAAADLSALGMPAVRRAAIIALARAAVVQPKLFQAADTVEESVTRLRTVSGIGEWTAQYIALRGLHHPDAFPASDLGILRGAEALMGTRPSSAELLDLAERWRPWRGYAAQHLWSLDQDHAASLKQELSAAARHTLTAHFAPTTSTFAAAGGIP